MNPYLLFLLFILTALTAAWLLNLLTAVLELPPEFRDVYDVARYRQSQDYTKARLIFAQARETVILAATVFFWCGVKPVDQIFSE